MTDLVRAEPVVLVAYTQTTTTATAGVSDQVDAYATAWATLLGAGFAPSQEVPSCRDQSVRDLLAELTALDREPALLAEALERLDVDGDGALTEADGIDAAYLTLSIRNQVLDPDALTANDEFMQETAASLITVVNDGSDGQTRVVTLHLDDDSLLTGLTPAQLQAVLELYGLTGESGPLHVVAHGLGASAESITDAAVSVAGQYDNQGITGATVLAIDWSAGSGAQDLVPALLNAHATGDELAAVFTAIAASNPDAIVAVTANSLGNEVMIRALSQMDDPIEPGTEPFSVDYTAIQPTIDADAYAADPEHYGALANGRIEHLTLTINPYDGVLFGYEEVFRWTDALGAEWASSDAITTLLAQREQLGLTTDLVQHESGVELGHLGIDPELVPLVELLIDEQLDRLSTGDPSPQTAIREDLMDPLHGPLVTDVLLGSDELQGYLSECQQQGTAPDRDEVGRICLEVLEEFWEDLGDDVVELLLDVILR